MGGAARLLVADDDRSAAEAIGRVLEHHGYQVQVVTDGAEARTSHDREVADLLIADIYMPGNVDLELLAWEPVRTARLPLILMTGQPTLATAIKALRVSVVDYVTKPVDPDYLVERVAAGLRRRRAEREAAVATAEIGRLLKVLHGRFDVDAELPGETASMDIERRIARLPVEQRDALSGREREVIIELIRRGSLAAVSRSLNISPHTVRGHLASVFRKLEVASQVELVARLMGGDAS